MGRSLRPKEEGVGSSPGVTISTNLQRAGSYILSNNMTRMLRTFNSQHISWRSLGGSLRPVTAGDMGGYTSEPQGKEIKPGHAGVLMK